MGTFTSPVVAGDDNSTLADVSGITGMTQATYWVRIHYYDAPYYYWQIEFFVSAVARAAGTNPAGATGGLSEDGESPLQGGLSLRGSITVANFVSIAEDQDITITWTETADAPTAVHGVLDSGEGDGIGRLLGG